MEIFEKNTLIVGGKKTFKVQRISELEKRSKKLPLEHAMHFNETGCTNKENSLEANFFNDSALQSSSSHLIKTVAVRSNRVYSTAASIKSKDRERKACEDSKAHNESVE